MTATNSLPACGRTYTVMCIRAGGIEPDVSFTDAGHLDADVHDALDATYHAECDRFGPGPVGHVTGPDARTVTLRLDTTNGSTS